MHLILLLGSGFEEIEALATLDLLRRAEISVTTAAIGDAHQVTGSHHITVLADRLISEVTGPAFDGVIIPGGMGGVNAIAADTKAIALIKSFADDGKLVAAICAAPACVLLPAGVLQPETRVTGYPAQQLIDALGDHYTTGPLCHSHNILTAAGPGTAFEFARAIITEVHGADVAQRVFAEALIS